MSILNRNINEVGRNKKTDYSYVIKGGFTMNKSSNKFDFEQVERDLDDLKNDPIIKEAEEIDKEMNNLIRSNPVLEEAKKLDKNISDFLVLDDTDEMSDAQMYEELGLKEADVSIAKHKQTKDEFDELYEEVNAPGEKNKDDSDLELEKLEAEIANNETKKFDSKPKFINVQDKVQKDIEDLKLKIEELETEIANSEMEKFDSKLKSIKVRDKIEFGKKTATNKNKDEFEPTDSKPKAVHSKNDRGNYAYKALSEQAEQLDLKKLKASIDRLDRKSKISILTSPKLKDLLDQKQKRLSMFSHIVHKIKNWFRRSVNKTKDDIDIIIDLKSDISQAEEDKKKAAEAQKKFAEAEKKKHCFILDQKIDERNKLLKAVKTKLSKKGFNIKEKDELDKKRGFLEKKIAELKNEKNQVLNRNMAQMTNNYRNEKRKIIPRCKINNRNKNQAK